jgi:hypothetical protein
MHAQDYCHLHKTPAVPDGEDGEEILDLAQVAQLLGRLQSVFHRFTGVRCEGKTDAAHREVPPKTTWERCFFGWHFPDVWRHVNPSSENLFLEVYSNNQFIIN